MPDPLIAVLVFVGGAVTNALISLGTAEYRAHTDHKRKLELDRSTRDRQAAAAILEEVDRIIEKYSTRFPRNVEQKEIEPHYRVIRRRAVEIGDPVARKLADEIARDFYFIINNAKYIREDEWNLAQLVHHVAQETLGAVVRGDRIPEPIGLQRLRAAEDKVNKWVQEMFDEDEDEDNEPTTKPPEPDPK